MLSARRSVAHHSAGKFPLSRGESATFADGDHTPQIVRKYQSNVSQVISPRRHARSMRRLARRGLRRAVLRFNAAMQQLFADPYFTPGLSFRNNSRKRCATAGGSPA